MLMGVERIEAISAEMLANGRPAELPVALIRWATTGRQETLVGTLGDIAQRVQEAKFAAPAVAVFGEVVSLRKELNWFEGRPLSGKRIVVTRTRTQAGVLSEQLRALGADVFELPTIRIEPPTDLRAFAELVQDAHVYDWIVFTSPNGVDAFFDLFYKLYHDARELGGAKIAAIGPATAQRIKDFHLQVDLQPDEFVAEAVVREFKKIGGVENLRILLARAEKARDVLPKELSAMGGIVDEGFAYQTVPETRDDYGARRRLLDEGADLITFTSSSTVENFMASGSAVAERNAGGEHRAGDLEDSARPGIDGGRGSASARHPGLGGCHPKILRTQSLIMASAEISLPDEFASSMQKLVAEAEKRVPPAKEDDEAVPDGENDSAVLEQRIASLEEAMEAGFEKIAAAMAVKEGDKPVAIGADGRKSARAPQYREREPAAL